MRHPVSFQYLRGYSRGGKVHLSSKFRNHGMARLRSAVKRVADAVVESAYFKKEKFGGAGLVDTEWVKTLDNGAYFEWLAEQTGGGGFKVGGHGRSRTPRFYQVPGRTVGPLSPAVQKPCTPRIEVRCGKLINPPVDTVGGSTIPFTVGRQCGISRDQIEPKTYRVQVLVGVMLSSQTKDEMTAKAMYNVMRHCIDSVGSVQGITVPALLQIDERTLDSLISCVGFHQRKSNYILRTCQILEDSYGGDIPETAHELQALPGVGPKMTYLTLQKAWGKMDGICVDVHVDRFCKLFKWVDPNRCKTPDMTRIALQEWLPLPLWSEINSLLVGMGQLIDRPRANRVKICEQLTDPAAIEMVQHMTSYKNWVKYLQKGVKEETGATDMDTGSPVQVKLEPSTLVRLEPATAVKLEPLDTTIDSLTVKGKTEDTMRIQIKTEPDTRTTL
ncbi:uncharacterized protein KNAG_0D04820 [Huiozyma naganishii CBS 8797]|uniref:DNA-(apurinic or apyrimidinic site) lyase n=1 Tax=Huiozyma naganishii (strain ATCC MYA-139 / BCRC 22969 / CBS 8797 / KCTC 17520 / NBRC 10181 / NCYC 3082 / Yp74L-3) TaxID=1071383 RepID=J7S7B2_HUIN7|nr:hypothetical protein KNAG_0D04820 [Kazachstania naganishii CBS 8797]CCK70221.1 hypothetical protein KNAG_0D04820 [Kazachstania naganishii CBS 8797]